MVYTNIVTTVVIEAHMVDQISLMVNPCSFHGNICLFMYTSSSEMMFTAMFFLRVRECNCYEEGPNSNRNPNTATATQPNAGCVSGRLLSNPVYITSPSQEEQNTTPLYQDSSFDAEAPSLMHTYETTSPGASDELCSNDHSPAPYEMPIPHPTKSAVPVAVESDSKEYAQLDRSHVYATLEPLIAKHEDMEEQNDDYSRLHY